MWEENWEIINGNEAKQGGQGKTLKVRSLSGTGIIGCLKELHQEHLNNTERRFRMQQEAAALQALEGNGAPKLLDSNVEYWNQKDVPLYIVMEWIEGPTLSEIKRPINLDYTLSAINSILQIVDKCHGLHIHHRDLKPDNLIVRHSDLNQIVLVDFGMSWSKLPQESARIFDTPIGSELGNRFLRLPENAPGQIAHDPRSDITMIIGLLYFLLTGKAPRQLLNGNNQMPHEEFEGSFSKDLLTDPRWPRLKRVFHIGFQFMLDMRFQNIKQLADKLADLTPPDQANDFDALQSELSQINDVLNTETARKIKIEEGALKVGADTFIATLNNAVSEKGFAIAGNGPTLDRAQKAIRINFVLHRTQTETPTAKFYHLISISEGVLTATVQIEEGIMENYYTGALADIDGLKEAAENRAKRLFIDLLQVMKSKLEHHYS